MHPFSRQHHLFGFVKGFELAGFVAFNHLVERRQTQRVAILNQVSRHMKPPLDRAPSLDENEASVIEGGEGNGVMGEGGEVMDEGGDDTSKANLILAELLSPVLI